MTGPKKPEKKYRIDIWREILFYAAEIRKHEKDPEYHPVSDRTDRLSLSAIADDLEQLAKEL